MIDLRIGRLEVWQVSVGPGSSLDETRRAQVDRVLDLRMDRRCKLTVSANDTHLRSLVCSTSGESAHHIHL